MEVELKNKGVYIKIYQIVTRIEGKTEVYEFEISLDVNTDLYPVSKGEFYKICIATPASMDDESNDYYSIVEGKNPLLEEFDYVMHGKVFRYGCIKLN